MSAAPAVFALPPGVDFAEAVLRGLDARLAGDPPETRGRALILVNTRRTARRLQALAEAGPPGFLPRIRTIADLAEDPAGPLPPAPEGADPLSRHLTLARLVRALLAAEPALGPRAAGFGMARALQDLLDACARAGVPLARLGDTVPAEHAAHWQKSLRFLSILAAAGLDQEDGAAAGGEARLTAAIAATAAAWAAAPPAAPVLVAGSTGSRGTTLALMRAVVRLPRGAVILPGHDPDLPPAIWAMLTADPGLADHPQAVLAATTAALGADPAALPAWHAAAPPCPARGRLISLALRPAPVTDQWRAEAPALTGALAAATAGLTLIEADDPHDEARRIALALRGAAEDGRRAALITPDRTLARRVTAELDRWGIRPDDSAGRPLAMTPPGVFLSLILQAAGAAPSPGAFLALMRHPLVAGGPARGLHRRLTAAAELRCLRGGGPRLDWDRLAARLSDLPGSAAWVAWARAALARAAEGGADLSARAAAHLAAAEALAAGPPLADDPAAEDSPAAAPGKTPPDRHPSRPDATAPDPAAPARPPGSAATAAAGPAPGVARLWDGAAGQAALEVMSALVAAGRAAGPVDAGDHAAILAQELAARNVPEEAVVTHPGIAIWGTLEARVQTAELVILGGLNEGVWPAAPPADPWINRAMARAAGLPLPEQRIGLAAHDFQQAVAAAEVILSRARRDPEAPTVPSRWLMRLIHLIEGMGVQGKQALAAMRARGTRLGAWAEALTTAQPVPPAARPAPVVPAHALPRVLTVSDIDRLSRDPYAVYAQRVLGLAPLEALEPRPDQRQMGMVLHEILAEFVAETADGLPPDAGDRLIAIAGRVLEARVPWPDARLLWLGRLARARDALIAQEAQRRLTRTPARQEVEGRLTLPLAPALTLVGRADRIDRLADGAFAITDYKSGSLPSAVNIPRHAPQLPILAAIAEAGGFDGLPPGRVAVLELASLGHEAKTFVFPDADRAGQAALARLTDLIGAYWTGRPWLARLRPERLSHAGDYDHLARRGEWPDGAAHPDARDA